MWAVPLGTVPVTTLTAFQVMNTLTVLMNALLNSYNRVTVVDTITLSMVGPTHQGAGPTILCGPWTLHTHQ